MNCYLHLFPSLFVIPSDCDLDNKTLTEETCNQTKKKKRKEKLEMAVLECITSVWVMWPTFSRAYSLYSSIFKLTRSLTCMSLAGKSKEGLNFWKHGTEINAQEFHIYPSSSPFSWFFALPVKNIISTTTNYLTSTFSRVVSFHRYLLKSHSKDATQFGFSCRPSCVHQATHMTANVLWSGEPHISRLYSYKM